MAVPTRLDFLGSPWVAALAAGIGYGAWAFFVNAEHGSKPAWLAGFGQGSYAFVFTLLLADLSLKVCRWKGFPVAYGLAALLLLSVPAGIHTFLETPDISEAIVPGFIIGNIYIWLMLRARLEKPDAI